MSKEKQIEEIAKVLCEDCARDVAPCTLNKSGRMCDSVRKQAEALYNAGYRKQSEGEWIEASNKPHAACGKKCSLCGARISYREYGHGNHKYCHKCGAKMKGGAE